MRVNLLNEHHLECLSFKGEFPDSSESTLHKMPHCWKSHVTVHMYSVASIYEPVHEILVCIIPQVILVHQILVFAVSTHLRKFYLIPHTNRLER